MKRSRIVSRRKNARKRRLKAARQRIANRQQRVQRRIEHKAETVEKPMFSARSIPYEISDRTQAICYGGLGLMHSLFMCNDRCNQAANGGFKAAMPHVIEQMKHGPRAFRAPLDNLYSNRAYLVMASLAWSLKAWSALWLPETGRWNARRRAEKQNLLRMEFRTFVNTIIRVPCQIVKTGRRIIYRILHWNESQPVFWRMVEVLQC